MKLEYKLTIDHDTLKEAFESYEDFRYLIDCISNQISEYAEFNLMRYAIESEIDTSNIKEK